VQARLKKARSTGSQRTHCAELARFCRVCDHLGYNKNITTYEELVKTASEVISWAADNGAKIFWLKAIRTALSVLFNYRLDKELTDSAQVKSLMRACELEQPKIKKPLQLNWKLSDLLNHIRLMPPNARLTYGKLQRKCIGLVMIFTTARFSEMEQFKVNAQEPKGKEKSWRFIVRIKGKNFLQPIEVHATEDKQLDPIIALKALKQRMRTRKLIKRNRPMGSFWRTERGKTMTAAHLRAQVKSLLSDAGIQERSPYHIKHATLTCLHQKGASADDLRRMARHDSSSTAYTDFYLEDDLGASCSRMIESAMKTDDHHTSVAKKAKKEREAKPKPLLQRRLLRSAHKRS
jgi:site-specific recombinase XerD